MVKITIWEDTHYLPGSSLILMCHKRGNGKAIIEEHTLDQEENSVMSHVKASYKHLIMLVDSLPDKSEVVLHLSNHIVYKQLTEEYGSDGDMTRLIDELRDISTSKELSLSFIYNIDKNRARQHYKSLHYRPPRQKKPKPVKIKKEDKLAWVRKL